MQQLIKFLLEHPIIALFVLGAVFQTIGQARTKTTTRGRTGSRPQRQQAPAQRSAPGAGRPTEEEIAAEMRRILGMEPRSAAQRAPAPRPAPRQVAPPREAATERSPEPLRTQALGKLAVQVDPHVGQRIEQRRAPVSGAVGGSELGKLGGRVAPRRLRSRAGAHLVDLTSLPRAIVLREILDRPLALRQLD